MRVCAEPGCPELTTDRRCQAHTRQQDQRRGTTAERGYGTDYVHQRKAIVRRMAAGEIIHCWRCNKVIPPHELSLGHCDDDRSIIHGPEHLQRCNLANTRGGCTHPTHH